MSGIAGGQRWIPLWVVPWLLGAGTFLLVASTASHYGLTWDEPSYFYAVDLEIQWIAEFGRNLLKGEAAKSLQDEVIQAAWRWDPYHVPHPPFSRILSGLTKAILSPTVDKFVAYRVASAMVFALLVVVMYQWMAGIFDRVTGLFSALALLLMPNLFGQAHFALTDMPLTAMWLLTVYCFWRGLKSWRWSLALGVVWGFALATKFPAFLIPIPLLLWAHLFQRQSYTNNLFSMFFFSPMIMVGCQPYLWHQTLPRLATFFYDSASRGYRPETNFPILFYNRLLYSSEAPWHYPFFMTAVTLPETILLLSLIGVLAIFLVRSHREATLLFLMNAVFVLVTGLFPGAVLHDVNRLMLPALPFLAALAGCGFFYLAGYLAEHCQRITALQGIRHLRAKLIGVLAVLVLFPPAMDLYVYHPLELSYYNRLVGGIRGAYRRGLEVTYLMEAFTPDFLRYLNEKLPANATINASFSNFMFGYYQRENRLRRDIRITDGAGFDYYILLNRRSTFSEGDTTFLASRPHLYDAWRFDGVPLILVYRGRHY